MTTSTREPRTAAEQDSEAGFRPLSADEARVLRESQPSLSPWWVVVAQCLVGLVVAVVVGVWSGKANLAWSAAYGALAVVVPAAVFARGLTGRLASTSPVAAAAGFMVWEMVKLGLTLAMLIAAPRLVQALSWPALLAGLVLAMKVYWVALAFRPRGRQTIKE